MSESINFEEWFLTEEQARELDEERRVYRRTWPQPLLRQILWDVSWPERIALEANVLPLWAAQERHTQAHGEDCECASGLDDQSEALLDVWIDLHDDIPLSWDGGNLGMGTMAPSVAPRLRQDI
jgi:hypothetical protein